MLDSGGNFGRVARGGVMEAFIDELMQEPVAGIPLGAWQKFLKVFSEVVTETKLRNQLQQIEATWAGAINESTETQEAFANFAKSIERLIATLSRR